MPQRVRRVVADTNILISGTFWPGLSRLLIHLARHGLIVLLSSPDILQEIERTLRGPEFQLKNREVDRILRDVMSYTRPGRRYKINFPALRDSRDKHILELAAGSKADHIVSGDRDMTSLKRVNQIPILTAREFFQAEFPLVLKAYETGADDQQETRIR